MSDLDNLFVNLRKNIVPEASEETLKENYYLRNDVGNGFSFVSNKEKYLKEIDNIFNSKNGFNYYVGNGYIKNIERTINNYKDDFEKNKERQISILSEYKNVDNFYNKLSKIENDYEKKINNRVDELKESVYKLLYKYQSQILKIKKEENENSSLNKFTINTSEYYDKINSHLDELDDNKDLGDYIDRMYELYNKFGVDLQEIVYILRSNNVNSEIDNAKKEIENSIIGVGDNVYIDQRLKHKILDVKKRINKEDPLVLFNELSSEINFFKENYQINKTTISSGTIRNFKNKLNSINNNFSKIVDTLTTESLDNGKKIKENFDIELEYINNRYTNDINNIKNDIQSEINGVILDLTTYLENCNSKIQTDLSKNGFVEISEKAETELTSNLEIERDTYINTIGIINANGTTRYEASDSKYFLDSKNETETDYTTSLRNAQNNTKQIIDSNFSYLKNNINRVITNCLNNLINIKNQFINERSNVIVAKNKCIESLNEIESFINNLNITTKTNMDTNPYYVYANRILGEENALDESVWQNYMSVKDEIRKENSASVKEYLLNSPNETEYGINVIYDKNLSNIDNKIKSTEIDLNNFGNNVVDSVSLVYPTIVIETTRACENLIQNITDKAISKNNIVISEINNFIDTQRQNIAYAFNEIKNDFVVLKYQDILESEKNKLNSIIESVKYDLNIFTNDENIYINNYVNMYKNKKSVNLLKEFENNIKAISNELKKKSSDKVEEANEWLIDMQKKLLGYDSCYFTNENYLEAIDVLYTINKKIDN